MTTKKGANAVEPIREIEKIQEIKNYLLRRSYRNYFLFIFGINSGLRISDILPLRVMDVKYTKHLIIQEKKTKNIRRTIITQTLKNEIERYSRKMADSEYLFPSQKGGKPISRVHAWQIINHAARACGVEGPIGTHTLRKTFGYHFYQQSKDVALLQYIFGHSSPSITMRYIGINDDMVDKALEKFCL
ncbi:site-specific integrase [Aneurinibacillus aneurinilyticus]|jgi:integrase|uniref:Site-specific integrase n=2 Tax=Aneurinibacillus aneurinilyticus TaxID=1391 RepID=A0A848D2A8_ANEAE|nr:site-specific integrase [Aneurinibacillus aneurinilyticus]ERI10181.1 site-specific recombinase, phage integrase family [Aneurinibacillus aneurinilyticus ATCC 12856]MCI1692489.1 site-specific integrase [Aneurinibacillus aneurinilyticus]MED0674016.1 site-specific integrase [Aneurinibacillus aneurinilyticus]MED0709556.1 site-specific integrase [Aneurinibacillus aneurinilyticus]MED0744302.1 site-specific integrase [Aneurinibacillus aneurinilyticus]